MDVPAGLEADDRAAFEFQQRVDRRWRLDRDLLSLAALLLGAVLLLYWVYDRMVGIDNLKLG